MFTNHDLVTLVLQGLFSLNVLPEERVISALGRVDRADFLPDTIQHIISLNGDAYAKAIEIARKAQVGITTHVDEFSEVIFGAANSQLFTVPLKALAYNDTPLQIGERQTCSQPSVVARLATALDLERGMSVLGIGFGCGYHEAVTAEIIGDDGKLTTIERNEWLAELGKGNLESYLEKSGLKTDVHCVYGDGSAGWPERAMYDRIYFTAGIGGALKDFDWDIILEQLNMGGKVLVPRESGPAILKTKTENGSVMEDVGDYVFVPLKRGVVSKYDPPEPPKPKSRIITSF